MPGYQGGRNLYTAWRYTQIANRMDRERWNEKRTPHKRPALLQNPYASYSTVYRDTGNGERVQLEGVEICRDYIEDEQKAIKPQQGLKLICNVSIVSIYLTKRIEMSHLEKF